MKRGGIVSSDNRAKAPRRECGALFYVVNCTEGVILRKDYSICPITMPQQLYLSYHRSFNQSKFIAHERCSDCRWYKFDHIALFIVRVKYEKKKNHRSKAVLE